MATSFGGVKEGWQGQWRGHVKPWLVYSPVNFFFFFLPIFKKKITLN
jgi:hypothetical protein